MAVDWGRRRVGVALSDPSRMLATPRPVLPGGDRRALVETLRAMAIAEEVDTILVGLPVHMSGEEGESAQEARRLGDDLARRVPGATVHFVDERLSTLEARELLASHGERARKSTGRLDQVAAALLLQSWLDGSPR